MMLMGGQAALSQPAAIDASAFIHDVSASLDCWTIAPCLMRAWAETAAIGSELVYARGWLPPRSASAAQARRLLMRGLVTCVQRRLPGGGKAYVLQRLPARPVIVAKPVRAKAPRIDGDMARVLRVLRLCAKGGLVCPTNRELSRQAKVINASYQIQKLIEANVIASMIIDRASGARRITIIATNQKTALPEGWAE